MTRNGVKIRIWWAVPAVPMGLRVHAREYQIALGLRNSLAEGRGLDTCGGVVLAAFPDRCSPAQARPVTTRWRSRRTAAGVAAARRETSRPITP
jgi:hypothetical protein